MNDIYSVFYGKDDWSSVDNSFNSFVDIKI